MTLWQRNIFVSNYKKYANLAVVSSQIGASGPQPCSGAGHEGWGEVATTLFRCRPRRGRGYNMVAV